MKIIRWLDDNLEEALLIALLVLMTLLMGLQVFSRYILNASLSWSEELTRYCIKKWISIKIDQVILMFPKPVYVVAQLVLNVILFALFAFLAWHAVTYLQMSVASAQKSPALGLPMPFVQAAPLVGFTLAAIRALQQIVLEIGNIRYFITCGKIKERGE